MSTMSERLKRALTDPERLAALAGTGLLDTPPEAVFDRAVALATEILGTPVGLLSIVDDRRQFFKAQSGLKGPFAEARGTPLSHSFCQYVVETKEAFAVSDARADPVLKNNPAIRDLEVVSYLGVPVRDPDGQVLGAFCAIDDEPREWSERDRRILENIVVGVESEIALRVELQRRIAAERTSSRAEAQLRRALRAGGLGTFQFDPRSGRADWDAAMYDLWWIAPGNPNPFAEAMTRVHPDDREADIRAREKALDPAGDGRHRIELRVVHPETGETRWLHLDGDVTFEDGVAVRVDGTVRDVTQRREAEAHAALLTKELQHRVKNLFTVTGGMVGLSARQSETTEEMAKILRGRIAALSAAHDIIQPAVTGRPDLGDATTLESLVDAVLSPHGDAGATIESDGPEVELRPRAASSLALVLHELATNAAKYGALAAPGGQLSVAWGFDESTDGPDKLVLAWREEGIAKAAAPTREGFGSTLIDLTVSGQLRGTWRRDWTSEGLVCRIELSPESLDA